MSGKIAFLAILYHSLTGNRVSKIPPNLVLLTDFASRPTCAALSPRGIWPYLYYITCTSVRECNTDSMYYMAYPLWYPYKWYQTGYYAIMYTCHVSGTRYSVFYSDTHLPRNTIQISQIPDFSGFRDIAWLRCDVTVLILRYPADDACTADTWHQYMLYA